MRATIHLRIAALLGGLLLAGCAQPLGLVRERVPAQLVLGGDTAEVSMPDTVMRGQSFDVTVVTFAGGCRRESAGAELSAGPQRAVITPYHHRTRASACPDDLLFLPHTVRLRFDEPGTARVEIRGTSNDADLGERVTWVTLERRVVVR